MDDTQKAQQASEIQMSGGAGTDTLSALQALLERQTERVDDLRRKIRAANESMKSILDNDEKLTEVSQSAEKASQDMKSRKKTLTESPEFREQRGKTVELKDELKELEETLNNHLISYFQQTGVKTFDTTGGDQREFKVYAKVLPKKGGGRE